MNIEISGQAEKDVQTLVASGAFASPTDAVQAGLAILVGSAPTNEFFFNKLREARDDFAEGRADKLDADDIIRRGRQRLDAKNDAQS